MLLISESSCHGLGFEAKTSNHYMYHKAKKQMTKFTYAKFKKYVWSKLLLY